MTAEGFGTLASYFPDRPVVTYDPRGTGRSTGPTAPPSPRPSSTATTSAGSSRRSAPAGRPVRDQRRRGQRAGAGGRASRAECAPSSPTSRRSRRCCRTASGAGRQPRHPRDLPARRLRPGDGEVHRAGHRRGPCPPRTPTSRPGPAVFGLPTEDDGSRDDALLGAEQPHLRAYEPDLDRLRAALDAVVVGRRGVRPAARRSAPPLGSPPPRHGPTTFPGDHAGFLGGRVGQTGQPEPFAARLREVLSAGLTSRLDGGADDMPPRRDTRSPPSSSG